MLPPDSHHRAILLAIGLLVILGPVAILVLTLGFLMLTGDLILGRVTPLEFLELYIIDVLLFAGLAYGIYWLTLKLVEQQVPASLEAIEPLNSEESANDEAVDADEPSEDSHR